MAKRNSWVAQNLLLETRFGTDPPDPADEHSRRASARRHVTTAAMENAAEPQNGSTRRVVLMGRYCRINGASARWLP
jgi:hypothetical protein